MYDAFSRTRSNAEPYNARPPTTNLTAKNPDTAANRRFARRYDLTATDRVPQRALDRMLWRAVRGNEKPPPPGPNAERERPGVDGDG
jgi:hypothetical protein